MGKKYDQIDTSDRIDFREYIMLFTPTLIDEYKNTDARKIHQYPFSSIHQQPTYIGSKKYSIREMLIAMKLGSPSLFLCDYFFWNTPSGTHLGVDIIMPQGTPIQTITDGTVVKIKQRNGIKKDEGNCVVIQTPDNYFVGYEHLDTIAVSVGDALMQGAVIGTCGTTGNSTQYHLHLQVDTASAPFHPYRHATAANADTHTVDPITFCRGVSPRGPFRDIPHDPSRDETREALKNLYNANIVKGFDFQAFPDNTLKRYEVGLLIDRICKQYGLYDLIASVNPIFTAYSDNSLNDTEFDEAAARLQVYGIMKGHAGKFYPTRDLRGEELLALLGRLFYGLQDTTSSPRREAYKQKFYDEGFIDNSWNFYTKPIPRKEVFILIWKVLEKKGLI